MAVNGGNSPVNGGLSWAMASARRRAIRQTMTPIRVKHGLQQAPMIKHSRDGSNTQPPKFGVGGGFKSGGF